MKQAFLWIVAIGGTGAILGFLLWRVLQALGAVREDWQAGREEAEMQEARKDQAEKRAARNAKRLDNGCEHHFDEMFGTFPPDVCTRCGLEKDAPQGMCDHIWRKIEGPVPGSRCERCGKTYGRTS